MFHNKERRAVGNTKYKKKPRKKFRQHSFHVHSLIKTKHRYIIHSLTRAISEQAKSHH